MSASPDQVAGDLKGRRWLIGVSIPVTICKAEGIYALRVLGCIHLRKQEGLRSAELAGIKLTAAAGVRAMMQPSLWCMAGATGGLYVLLVRYGARFHARR